MKMQSIYSPKVEKLCSKFETVGTGDTFVFKIAVLYGNQTDTILLRGGHETATCLGGIAGFYAGDTY